MTQAATTTKLQEITAQAHSDHAAGRTCTPCKDTGMIRCPEHVLVDGWCDTCETGETKPARMSCPCANLPALTAW
jgi:hypothetical protein